MTTTDRRDATDAPAPSAAEQAVLDRIENAPACDESTVERVARAMWEADAWPADQWEREGGLWDARRSEYRNLARAAIDALKPAPGTDTSGQAVQRDHSPGHCVSVEDANRVLAETRDSTEDALHRVLDLADDYQRVADEILAEEPNSIYRERVAQAGYSTAARIRAAVAGPQRDHDEEGGQ